MASLIDRLGNSPQTESRYSFSQWLTDLSTTFSTGGNQYTLPVQTTFPNSKGESIPNHFDGYVRSAYQSNGPVFATLQTRLMVFTEARFQFRRFENGRPGDLWGDESLRLLEEPWSGGTTGELLARMEQDGSLAGNAFVYSDGTELTRLPPNEVAIVEGSHGESDMGVIDRHVVGYMYQPGGIGGTSDPVFLPESQVAHWSPIPDPLASWRGMSWLTPILREIDGDRAASDHKLKFFENGATPNMVVTLDKTIGTEAFDAFREIMEDASSGTENAYKTLYLGGGADVEVVGQSFEQMSFKATQGAGETRIAAAGGVPPVLVGLSEGLSSATYSNYGQARRRFADATIRPLWRMAAGTLAKLVPVPADSVLWYDDRDIPFLREDAADIAEIQSRQASTIRQLVDGGFKPETVVTAVESQNMSLLEHTGNLSVQLLPGGSAPGANTPEAPDE